MLTQDTARIEAVIHEQILAILREQPRSVRKLSAKDTLSDTLGLSSLDLATLISELELVLEADPFTDLVPVTSIRTVGDLVQAYQMALQPRAAIVPDEKGLSSAAERGRLRQVRRKK